MITSTVSPHMVDQNDAQASFDYQLLRRFEPVVRYTQGERFFPMDINRYIHQCSLWVQRPEEPPELLVPQGELTLEKLVENRQDRFGAVYFLKFIEPLDLLELARYTIDRAVQVFLHADESYIFRAGRGRLARVGYFSRLMDALFSLSLFLRGRVPGDTAAAAALLYKRIQEVRECYTYYGRVVRVDRWLVLQYWYFYPFNNWRSGFFGVNDHEGDWEMVNIYCSQEEAPAGEADLTGAVTPQWVAYASHDFSGDDLRRRWDDPEVEKLGDHPVIYAGAGSHASYFSGGEYISELELPFLAPLVSVANKLQSMWVSVLRQAGATSARSELNVFKVPFVDYARGDGISIGAGGSKEWDARLLDPVPAWVSQYRGLWGLFARDPISGENAPAGPMYNRDGTVRAAWYDPLNWAGLDKIPPPDEALSVLQEQRQKLLQVCAELRGAVSAKSNQLQGMGVIGEAMLNQAHLQNAYKQHQAAQNALAQEVHSLRRQLTIEEAKLAALELYEAQLKRGEKGPVRAHLKRAATPTTDIELRWGRLAELVSATSVGILLITIVALVLIEGGRYLLFGLAAMIGLLVFIESGFRRQLTRLITSISLALAIVNAFVLLFEFFWPAVVLTVLVAGIYIIWENFQEIRG